MKVNDLSALAYVLEQSRIALNSGANNRAFPKEKLYELRRRVSKLEERFLDEVLSLDINALEFDSGVTVSVKETAAVTPVPSRMAPAPSRKLTGKAVKKVEGGLVVTSPSAEELHDAKADVPDDVADQRKLASQLVKGEAPSMEDEELEFRRKLAEAKKDIAQKKKK